MSNTSNTDGADPILETTVPENPSLETFDSILVYSATLTSSSITKMASEIFPAIYTLALPESQREAVFNALKKVLEIPISAVRADWRAYKITHPDEKNQDSGSGTQSDRLVELALESAVVFHNGDEEAYADIENNGHRETYAIREKAFKGWLANKFYTLEGKAPNSQAMQDALGVLEGKALFEGACFPVAVRITALEVGTDTHIFLDLGTADWSCVWITCGGWQVIQNPPVRFFRPSSLKPLAIPEMGGSVDELRDVVNISLDQWGLAKGFLVGLLNPTGSQPIAEIIGQRGSAKTSTARIFKRLIDDSKGLERSTPKNEDDMMVAARGNRVVFYDNLAKIETWFSDALCRLSTGGALSKRKHYANAEEVVLEARRPVILTGISELATRPDLLDRLVRFNTPVIPPSQRKTDGEAEAAFLKVWPRVLGALLTAAAQALQNLATTKPAELPRLADWALWVTACEPSLGMECGEFLEAYKENRVQGDASAIDANPAIIAILELMATRTHWKGTFGELLEKLTDKLEKFANGNPKKPKEWPSSPKDLSNTLRNYAPTLEIVENLSVQFGKRTNTGIMVTLEWIKPETSIESSSAEYRVKTSSLSTPSTLERTGQGKTSEHGGEHASEHVHGELDVHAMYTPSSPNNQRLTHESELSVLSELENATHSIYANGQKVLGASTPAQPEPILIPAPPTFQIETAKPKREGI
jgi:hypothetical protein